MGLTYSLKKDKILFMLNYAICQIKGKQYKVVPNKPFEVDLAGDEKEIEAEVLLKSEDGKIEVGTPVLKNPLVLQNLGMIKGDKIRVAKFHAKANYRRVTGFRPKHTKVVYTVKKD